MENSFVYNETRNCDHCNSERTTFKMTGLDEIEKRLAKKFLTYESCQHHICFHCIEDASMGHFFKIKEIKCPKCQNDNHYTSATQIPLHTNTLNSTTIYNHFPLHTNNEILNPNLDSIVTSTNLNIIRIMNNISGFPSI